MQTIQPRIRNIDYLRIEIEKLNGKFDRIMSEIPANYQEKQDYRIQHAKLESRVDNQDARIQLNAEKVEQLYRENREWANNTFAELIKQFTEESKAIRKEISDLRISLYGLIIASILLPILFIVITHYVWH